MITEHLTSIENYDTSLRMIPDNLPAHTAFASNDYFMSVIGFLFLGHATNRHHEAETAIETDQATAKMPKRPLASADVVEPWQYGMPPDETMARIADTNGSRQVEL